MPFASASGSLPASSVKVLLDRWTQYRDDWRQSEADWKNNQTSESDAVRLNRCQARAKVLEQVIEELRAEVAAANVRQPEENAAMSDWSGEQHERTRIPEALGTRRGGATQRA